MSVLLTSLSRLFTFSRFHLPTNSTPSSQLYYPRTQWLPSLVQNSTLALSSQVRDLSTFLLKRFLLELHICGRECKLLTLCYSQFWMEETTLGTMETPTSEEPEVLTVEVSESSREKFGACRHIARVRRLISLFFFSFFFSSKIHYSQVSPFL